MWLTQAHSRCQLMFTGLTMEWVRAQSQERGTAREQKSWDGTDRASRGAVRQGVQEGSVTRSACPGTKGTATGTRIKAKPGRSWKNEGLNREQGDHTEVQGPRSRSLILSTSELEGNNRAWGQGRRAENRAKAKKESKAETVVKPGTSR